jgi:hypothetical protein
MAYHHFLSSLAAKLFDYRFRYHKSTSVYLELDPEMIAPMMDIYQSSVHGDLQCIAFYRRDAILRCCRCIRFEI